MSDMPFDREFFAQSAIYLEHKLAASQKECAELRSVLSDARVKLQLYRSAHSGEYVGGIEFTALISRIDTMMKGE